MREKIGSIFTFSIFSDISKKLMELRMIKSNEEIEIIKNGARIADIGGYEILQNIKENATEMEIAIKGRDRMEREIVKTYPDAEYMDTWVWFQSGINTDELWDSWLTFRSKSIFMDIGSMSIKDINEMTFQAIWEYNRGKDIKDNDIDIALEKRKKSINDINQIFKDYDFLALPSAQVFPFKKELNYPEKINDFSLDTYHRWIEVFILSSLLELPTPDYHHHKIITDENGVRLAKRNKSASLKDLRESGQKPEDLIRRLGFI